MSTATPASSRRAKTPSTAQPSSIRTRSMSTNKLTDNPTSRRGSLPAVVKGRRALDLKTINRRYDEDDQRASQAAGPSKLAVCAEGADGGERPAKLARKGRSPVKGKGKQRAKELAGEDAEMGAASEDELAEEHKPARFLPIPPRSPISGPHPSTSHASNPFHVRHDPTVPAPLPRSNKKFDLDERMGSDDSSESDDSLLLMPSPKKTSPQKPSSLSSVVAASGIKRSRSDAFLGSSPAGHTSPPKFVIPKTPIVDVANPFYVSPAPKPAATAGSPSADATSPAASTSASTTIPASSPITSGISSTIDSLNIRTPKSQRKRAREVFSGSHGASPEAAAPAPMKSCLSSSSSGSGSSPMSRSSSDGDGSSPRKRVHFSSPPPHSREDQDATMDSPSSAKATDPLSSPPPTSSLPPMIDIVALSKRKLKSPRKRVLPKVVDGSVLSGVREGGRAVKKLEGLTVPKPFAFGSLRSSSSVSASLASLAEGKKGKEKEVKKAGDSSMGPPALPRAFGAYASTSTSLVPASKKAATASSGGTMSSSSSRTNLSSLAPSTSRIPQASTSASASTSSMISAAAPRQAPSMKPSLPSSRSISSLSSLSNPKRAPASSSGVASSTSTLASSTSSALPTRTSKYPSSLGSRPPPSANRPQPSTARKTSVPVPSSVINLPKPPPRAVSDPVAAAAPSAIPAPRIVKPLPSSASERRGLSSEGRSAMAGLAESLAKMQVRKAAAAAGAVATAAGGSGIKRMSASSTMPNIAEAASSKIRSTGQARPAIPSSSSTRVLHPPPNPPSSGIPTSTSSKRLSTAASRRESSSSSEGDSSFTSNGGGVSLTSSKSTQSLATLAQMDTIGAKVLSGVVAFVDVRTAEGDEAGGMFVDILRGLGAKVLARPSDSVTHIVFKAGKSSTLAHYRKFMPAVAPTSDGGSEHGMMALEDLVNIEGLEETGPGGKTVHLVGIGWVIRCKEEKKRVNEFDYRVDLGDQNTFQKRRKSMEPKQMRAALEQPSANPMAASVEKARRRSLLFAPRISSPLKRASFIAVPLEDENEDALGGDNMLA